MSVEAAVEVTAKRKRVARKKVAVEEPVVEQVVERVEQSVEEKPKRTRKPRVSKVTKVTKVTKVDEKKLEESRLPPADPEKPEFTDERIQYYRLMAKAIWTKCSDCVNGKATLTDDGYAVPDCWKSGCPLYSFRGEIFKEKIRRGSASASSDGSPLAGPGRKGTRKARDGAAVRRAADNDDNDARGSGVRSGPGNKKDPGVVDASGSGAPGEGDSGTSGRHRVRRGGGDSDTPSRKVKGGAK